MFDPRAVPPALAAPDDALGARLEEAGLSCSQPPQQTIYDGWLLRASPGRAKRARSVNALAAGRLPLAEKLAHVEAFYRRAALPPVYRITPYTQPAALDAVLADAGYAAADESRVMWRPLDGLAAAPTAAALRELGVDDFVAAVGRLRDSPAAIVAAERERIGHCALPARFLAWVDGDRIVACGCVLIDADAAGIFNMVTAADARGRGHATLILAALLTAARNAAARVAYLQVDAANAPARRLYQRAGFTDRYAYWYRARPGDEGHA
jgi:ribosomal protein S18 acetylase RimI-like enzyme